jgi:hypothetical protein
MQCRDAPFSHTTPWLTLSKPHANPPEARLPAIRQGYDEDDDDDGSGSCM